MEIVVVDEHHEALLFWDEHKEALPKQLIHVDYHSDMWAPGRPEEYQYSNIPGYLNLSLYSDNVKELVEKELCPTSFIIPSILRGLFNDITFVRPVGLEKPTKVRRIGTLLGAGKIIRSPNDINASLFQDEKQFSYKETTFIPKMHDSKYTLDIDLDYFCCNLNPERLFQMALPLPEDIKSKHSEWSSSQDQYNVNFRFLDVDCNDFLIVGKKTNFSPRYNPSRAWMKYLIDSLIQGLQYRPSYVTICRSIKSGYTPVEHAEFLEEYLLYALQKWDVVAEFPYDDPLAVSEFAVEGKGFLYNYALDISLPLDSTGQKIWELVKEGRNTKEVIEGVAEYYSCNAEEIHNDILEFILSLRRLLMLN